MSLTGRRLKGGATISPSLLIWGDMGELPCPPLMGGGASISPSSPTQWEGTGYCLSFKGGLILSLLPHMGLLFLPTSLGETYIPPSGSFFFLPTSLGETYVPPSGSCFFLPTSLGETYVPPSGSCFFCPRLWVRHTSPLVGLVFFAHVTGET